MNLPAWLVPKVSRSALGTSLLFGLKGAGIAGAYGIVHDAITFKVGPMYFTEFKFHQFQWADFGLPRHLFAMEIGFLASWWVGMGAGYLLARYALQKHGPSGSRYVWRAIGCMFGCALAAFGLAYLAGRQWAEDEFQHVAWIHNSSYAGAILGLILGCLLMRKRLPEPIVS
jgi:hypothetical protein